MIFHVHPDILLMEEILHQLIWRIYHYSKVLYIPGGAEFLPSTVSPIRHGSHFCVKWHFWGSLRVRSSDAEINGVLLSSVNSMTFHVRKPNVERHFCLEDLNFWVARNVGNEGIKPYMVMMGQPGKTWIFSNPSANHLRNKFFEVNLFSRFCRTSLPRSCPQTRLQHWPPTLQKASPQKFIKKNPRHWRFKTQFLKASPFGQDLLK